MACSVAWEGYPAGFSAIKSFFSPCDEPEWRARVRTMLESREDATLPEQGWPWPWDDSRTTDYAYALDGGAIHASSFGYPWFNPNEEEPEMRGKKVAVFPNMKDRKSVTLGPRSGVIVFGAK